MTTVIIPALNEEESIGRVLKAIPATLVDEILVINNASTDCTEMVALNGGAIVLNEQRKGYGYACLRGLEYIKKQSVKPDIVVFLDADYSDHPEEMPRLIEPILKEDADLVIGSRSIGNRLKGSMTPQQVFGNWLATRLIKFFYKVKFTDLGPFRAIRYDVLEKLNMTDKTYGWTVEMQLKAARMKLKCIEVPVSYRPRIGQSKISGTFKGTVMAGYKIITTIFKHL